MPSNSARTGAKTASGRPVTTQCASTLARLTNSSESGASAKPSTLPSMGKTQRGAGPAWGRGGGRQTADRGGGAAARGGKTEPNPAGGDVARRVEPEERAKYRFALLRRDTGTVVVDHDVDAAAAGQRSQPNVAAMAESIAHEVADAALHRVGAQQQAVIRRRRQRDRSCVAPRHHDDLVEERLQVDLDRRFRALAAREIKIALDHLLHIGDIRFELVDGNTI